MNLDLLNIDLTPICAAWAQVFSSSGDLKFFLGPSEAHIDHGLLYFLPRSLLNSFFLLQAHVNLKCPCAAAHCIEASRTLMFPSRAPRQGHFSNPSQMLTTARMLAKAKAFSYIVSRLAILSPRLSRNPTGANSRPTFVHLGDFTNLTRPNVHRCLCHLVI